MVLEKRVVNDIMSTGCNIGSILGSWLSGVVNVYLGWQANFYINAAISLSFGLMWCLFVFDKPEQNSMVATDELIFISRNIIQKPKHQKLSGHFSFNSINKVKKLTKL